MGCGQQVEALEGVENFTYLATRRSLLRAPLRSHATRK